MPNCCSTLAADFRAHITARTCRKAALGGSQGGVHRGANGVQRLRRDLQEVLVSAQAASPCSRTEPQASRLLREALHPYACGNMRHFGAALEKTVP